SLSWSKEDRPVYSLKEEQWQRYNPGKASLSLRSPCEPQSGQPDQPQSPYGQYNVDYAGNLYACGNEELNLRIEKVKFPELSEYDKTKPVEKMSEFETPASRAGAESNAYYHMLASIPESIKKLDGVTEFRSTSRPYSRGDLFSWSVRPGYWLDGDFKLNGNPRKLEGFIVIESSTVWVVL